MLMAYILMHGTFVNLFLSMRKFGSNFWLGEWLTPFPRARSLLTDL